MVRSYLLIQPSFIVTLIILALLPAHTVRAEKYYVDAKVGDDQRNGKSPHTAWKTLARVNRAGISCSDTILLKRGSIWREPADFGMPCTANTPISVGAYGSGTERPIIESEGPFLFNVRVRSGSFLTIRDLELRGATLAPISLLNDGVTLINLLVSDANLPVPRLVNTSSTKRWHGAWLPGIYSDPAGVIGRFQNQIGSVPAVVNIFIPWASPWDTERFNVWMMDQVIAAGAIPMISWEPMNWANPDRSDRTFSLDTILSGAWDSHITAWAMAAALWRKTLLLRFAHEMNGDWSPWAVGDGRNGNTPAKYVAAWRRVYNLFRQAGAANVKFVWCPDGAANLHLLSELYPGDQVVDYVAFDQYNWGGNAWKDSYELLAPAYAIITSLTQRPLFLAETGVPEEGGVKADYITRMFEYTIPALLPQIRGVCWFNESKERDWRVATSAASLSTYNNVTQSYAWSL